MLPVSRGLARAEYIASGFNDRVCLFMVVDLARTRAAMAQLMDTR